MKKIFKINRALVVIKSFFLSLAVLAMSLCVNAQTNQYFWYQGNLMMGNPVDQIDSITFGEGEPVDTLHIMLPRTIIKTVEVHDTVYVTIHDTVFLTNNYVDLGLPSKNKWAKLNLGAQQEYDYGDYYFWGGLSPLDRNNIIPNATEEYLYENVGYTNLLSKDDAASQKLGGGWCIPTKDDFQELVDHCSWELSEINGTNGFRITGPSGASIFLPANGYYWDGCGFCNQETKCLYWTSNNHYYDSYATNVSISVETVFSSGNIFSMDLRITAEGIRPVYKAYKNNSDSINTLHDTIYIYIHDTICPNDAPEGALTGEFSIGSDKKIRFSKGNLQYHMKNGNWKFAENQWECLGYNNSQCGNTTYDGYIDLYGWSTIVTNYGIDTLKPDWSYYQDSFVDWGTTMGSAWRTLTSSEWRYLTEERANASQLCAVGRVGNTNGFILLPDNWNLSNHLHFTAGFSEEFSSSAWATINTYTETEWEQMENDGAIFLPANGYRLNGTGVSNVGYNAYYWGADNFCCFYILSNGMGINYGGQLEGRAVRLIQDIE